LSGYERRRGSRCATACGPEEGINGLIASQKNSGLRAITRGPFLVYGAARKLQPFFVLRSESKGYTS
jgi:hypothetical protein